MTRTKEQTKTTHTPGPWRAQDDFGTVFTTSDPVRGTGSTNAIAKAFNRLTAHGSDVEPGDEQAANARLMAAAPELLEALEYIVGWGPNWDAEKARDMAREAIAKAKGDNR